MPCGSHTLNSVVCDAAKSSVQAVTFFGILQRIYNLFSSSPPRWAILKENVTDSGLTVKPLSDTRWESHIESVKVLRYHLEEGQRKKKQLYLIMRVKMIAHQLHLKKTTSLIYFSP